MTELLKGLRLPCSSSSRLMLALWLAGRKKMRVGAFTALAKFCGGKLVDQFSPIDQRELSGLGLSTVPVISGWARTGLEARRLGMDTQGGAHPT